MKVFGGARNIAYEDPKSPPQLDVEHLEKAVRYSLGTPGVCTVNLGVHNQDQLRQNIEMVKRYTELTQEEQRELAQTGRRLARDWRDHFGPVA